MNEHITGWELLRREELERARAAFEARSDFGDLVAEAARRGYRRITLAEQMDSGFHDAYTWRGGVWIRMAAGAEATTDAGARS